MTDLREDLSNLTKASSKQERAIDKDVHLQERKKTETRTPGLLNAGHAELKATSTETVPSRKNP